MPSNRALLADRAMYERRDLLLGIQDYRTRCTCFFNNLPLILVPKTTIAIYVDLKGYLNLKKRSILKERRGEKNCDLSGHNPQISDRYNTYIRSE